MSAPLQANKDVRCEAFTAADTKVMVFWVLTDVSERAAASIFSTGDGGNYNARSERKKRKRPEAAQVTRALFVNVRSFLYAERNTCIA
jgi:hypothetical protein